jgi:hypothetical protein
MRKLTLLLLTGPIAVLLGGCGSGGDKAAPAPAPTTASAPAAAATTAPPSQGLGTASPTPDKTATTTATPRCHSGDLKVKDVPDPAGGAAGHHGEFLVFTNASDHRCTLYGYPGVSWVAGDNGTQVNAPFARTGGARKTLSLKPGASAHATLIVVNPDVYEKAACKPEKVRGYRVYPPDEKASIFVAAAQTVCSAKGKGLGQVRPITPGTSD